MIQIMPQLEWYCISIKTTLPWTVPAAHLNKQGFRSYFPVVTSKTFMHGRNIIVEEPLFHGYGFVLFGVDIHPNWRSINSTTGVHHLLPTTAEIPLPVPRMFIDEIKLRLENINGDRASVVETAIRFQENEIVKFIIGAMVNRPEHERIAHIVKSGKNVSWVKMYSGTVAKAKNSDLQRVQE